jgi:hypothetical protein
MADSDKLTDEEWHGIPIMPEAINAEGNPREYWFTVDATAEAVQAFYSTELELLGYSYQIPGGRVGPEAQSDNSSLPMVFIGKTTAVSITIETSGDISLVILRLL